MSKFKWVLTTAIATAIFSGLLTQSTQAQTNRSWSWKDILQVFSQENEPPVSPNAGGSRGDYFCAIPPRLTGTNREVWSDRPLFVWQGVATQIELRLSGSEKAVWSQKVTSDARHVMYGGKVLQPGQTYDWVIFDKNNYAVAVIPFQVMDAEKRDRIKTRLQILAGELKAKGASSEEIVRRRAQYFAQQHLWSDVLQEIYSVRNPSTELREMIQSVPTRVCRRQSQQNSLP
jgi:hypothetical protein